MCCSNCKGDEERRKRRQEKENFTTIELVLLLLSRVTCRNRKFLFSAVLIIEPSIDRTFGSNGILITFHNRERSTGRQRERVPHYRVQPHRVSAAINIWIVAMLKARLTRMFYSSPSRVFGSPTFYGQFPVPFVDDVHQPNAIFTASNRWNCNREELQRTPHDPFDVTRKKPSRVLSFLVNTDAESCCFALFKAIGIV